MADVNKEDPGQDDPDKKDPDADSPALAGTKDDDSKSTSDTGDEPDDKASDTDPATADPDTSEDNEDDPGNMKIFNIDDLAISKSKELYKDNEDTPNATLADLEPDVAPTEIQGSVTRINESRKLAIHALKRLKAGFASESVPPSILKNCLTIEARKVGFIINYECYNNKPELALDAVLERLSRR